jgi:hypothetical protein
MPRAPIDPAIRFERFVARSGSGCHLWTGSPDTHGYGRFYSGRERGTLPAHVFAWEQANGRRVIPGMDICHRCDNPPCVNPAHLFEGTRSDNVQDMLAKLRGAQGEASPEHRLKAVQVIAIRQRYAAGEPSTRLAAEYGVKRNTIGNIVRGERWRSVGGPITTKSTFGTRIRRSGRIIHGR